MTVNSVTAALFTWHALKLSWQQRISDHKLDSLLPTQTGKPGVGVWRTGLTGLRWRPGPRRLSSGGRERNVKDQIKRPPITSVPAATKIATQESGFWATQEPTNTDALTIASPRRGCHYYYSLKDDLTQLGKTLLNSHYKWNIWSLTCENHSITCSSSSGYLGVKRPIFARFADILCSPERIVAGSLLQRRAMDSLSP